MSDDGFHVADEFPLLVEKVIQSSVEEADRKHAAEKAEIRRLRALEGRSEHLSADELVTSMMEVSSKALNKAKSALATIEAPAAVETQEEKNDGKKRRFPAPPTSASGR